MLEPYQLIEFLGFLVDSRVMKLFLPQEKIDKIKKECQAMLRKAHSSARDLAHLIGLLTATNPACLPAPLHYRGLQRLKHKALSKFQSYDQQIKLDMDATKDLQFWTTQARKWNGRPIYLPGTDLTITSDASTSGWGASCGTSQTGGPWTMEEAQAHINLLELRAAFLALQTYASPLNNQHILLLIDNRTAIAYLNHKGGTASKELSKLAVEIWEWCLQRNLTIHAEHIHGKLNNRADSESRRNLDSSDWRLDVSVFNALMLKMGPCDVDLFAARHNAQLKRFYSYRPDPAAEATDALAQTWKQLTPYAFPPFVLIGRFLQKLRQDAVHQAVLIAPLWRSQPWFPILLERLIDYPRLLPQNQTLLTNPKGESHPLINQNSLQLVTWRVSGRDSTVRIFQKRLSTFCAEPGEKERRKATLQPGIIGQVGVIEGKLIPLLHL